MQPYALGAAWVSPCASSAIDPELTIGRADMLQFDWQEFLLGLQLLLIAVQIGVGAWFVHLTLVTQRRVQAADTSVKCQERYEQLLDTRGLVNDQAGEDRFYDRFWGAQADQFIHWRHHLIPDDTFVEWMLFRRKQFKDDRPLRENHAVVNQTFQAAWLKRYQTHYQHRPFGRFMAEIFAIPLSSPRDFRREEAEVRRVMRRYRS